MAKGVPPCAGTRNMSAIQMARIMFFCPRLCPPATLSPPNLAPHRLPRKNCDRHKTNDNKANIDKSPRPVWLATTACTICAEANTRQLAHK